MITVLGGQGFIGSHLVRHLQALGLEHQAPARDEPLAGRALGHVIYCIGLTGDFRSRPMDTVDAHVCHLLDVLRTTAFDSVLYLSSARLYQRNAGPAREDDSLTLSPLDAGDIYNLSKAAGEALVLSLGPKGRVVRPTQVYGVGQQHTFIAMLLAEAATGSITLQSSLESAKDYVSVQDLSALLVKIALGGRQRIYNVASGTPVSNARIVEAISTATGCRVAVLPDAPRVDLPRIDNARIRTEFAYTPSNVLDDLPGLTGAS